MRHTMKQRRKYILYWKDTKLENIISKIKFKGEKNTMEQIKTYLL